MTLEPFLDFPLNNLFVLLLKVWPKTRVEIQKWLQNPEMAPMSRTMMPPTFLPQLKPKKTSRKVVGLENLSIFVGTRLLRGGEEGCANLDAVVFGESYFEYVCGPLMPQIQ